MQNMDADARDSAPTAGLKKPKLLTAPEMLAPRRMVTDMPDLSQKTGLAPVAERSSESKNSSSVKMQPHSDLQRQPDSQQRQDSVMQPNQDEQE